MSTTTTTTAPRAPLRMVVLISGNGSNLQALIDATQPGHLLAAANCEIVLVVSNKPGAFGLTRATNANIATLTYPPTKFRKAIKGAAWRAAYDAEVGDLVAAAKPDIVVLAGWMHILTPAFLDRLPGKVINLHPALPGEFDGAHAIERAFQAFQEGKITRTGIMVHHVIPEVDRGEVIVKREVPIFKDDTLEKLEERIHATEHQLIVEGAVTFLKKLQPQRL
ncbi:hypothetical protein GGF32_008805 [Allomyces javanicus]|nr:hypothetical protein GGF32_008805 [Allomyces javanicus]